MRFLLLALVLAAPVAADEIVLKSGGRIACEVIEVTDEHVRIRLPHGTMTISCTKVAEIVREKRSAYLKREGAASLRAGSTRTAVELLGRVYRANPRDTAAQAGYVGALLGHARALRGENRIDEATKALQTLLGIDDGHAEAITLLRALRTTDVENARLYGHAVEAYRRRDYPVALRLFDQWRLRQPVGDSGAKQRMAAVHVAAGHADFDRGAMQDALNHFRAAVAFGAREVDRALFVLQPIAVLEALAGGETERASRLIDGIATRYPDRAVPVFLKAVTHHVSGEVEEAVRDYAAAARMAEGGKEARSLHYEYVRRQATAMLRAAIARPPQEGQARWRELFLGPLHRHDGAEHFTVFAPTRKQAEELGRMADALYERLARELLGGVPTAAKAELVMHPARRAYIAADPIPPNSPVAMLTLPRERSAGVAYLGLDEKARTVVRVELYSAPSVFSDTLPHEIVHVVQRRGVAIYRRAHWLDEGLATLYESDRSGAARLDNLRRATPMPLAEFVSLRSTPREGGTLFYDQAYVLTAYLRDLGNWRHFLDVFSRKGFLAALDEVHGIGSVDELERRLLSVLR